MELTSKEMKSASYKVAAQSGEYLIEGNVTVGSKNQVTTIESGNVTKQGVFVASFSLYGSNLNVNFADTVEVSEQKEVLDFIDSFKNVAVEE